jgi:hypothetical protein
MLKGSLYMPQEVVDEDINANVIGSFFRAKGVVPRCTFCGTDDLSVSEVSASAGFRVGMRLGTYANIFKLKSEYSDGASSRVLTITCNNCGHIMAFDFYVICEWLKTTQGNTIRGKANDD